MNFICIDPGSPTGFAIFDSTGRLSSTGTVKYKEAITYCKLLESMKQPLDIQFAVIERFEPFIGTRRPKSFKVQTQVQLCIEIFPNYITINTGQWNSRHHKDNYKRIIVEEFFGKRLSNSHETDAALIGQFVWVRAKGTVPEKPFEVLQLLAETKHKWPTAKEPSLYQLWQNRDSLRCRVKR